MWITLVRRYWQVSIFKETPANTPYSWLLLGCISILFVTLVFVQWMMMAQEQPLTFGSAVALLLSYGVYTFALLSAFKKPYRTLQTLTCLLAAHTIIHLCAFPLLLMTPWLINTAMVEPLGLLVGILYLLFTLALTIWQFLVTAYIYKQALMLEYLPAGLASIGLLACSILVVSFT